jgi:hypothetical protein
MAKAEKPRKQRKQRKQPANKRDLLRHIQQGHAQTILGSTEPDIVILRGHALVEAGLRTLLAAHLRVETAALPPKLSFYHLATIALARPEHASLLKFVLSLNTARNRYAHAVEPDGAAIVRTFISDAPKELIIAGRAAGATDVEVAAGAVSLILATLLQIGLQVARYRPQA